MKELREERGRGEVVERVEGRKGKEKEGLTGG